MGAGVHLLQPTAVWCWVLVMAGTPWSSYQHYKAVLTLPSAQCPTEAEVGGSTAPMCLQALRDSQQAMVRFSQTCSRMTRIRDLSKEPCGGKSTL